MLLIPISHRWFTEHFPVRVGFCALEANLSSLNYSPVSKVFIYWCLKRKKNCWGNGQAAGDDFQSQPEPLEGDFLSKAGARWRVKKVPLGHWKTPICSKSAWLAAWPCISKTVLIYVVLRGSKEFWQLSGNRNYRRNKEFTVLFFFLLSDTNRKRLNKKKRVLAGQKITKSIKASVTFFRKVKMSKCICLR